MLFHFLVFIGELDAWMNDEEYTPKINEHKKYEEPKSIKGVQHTVCFQSAGQISDRLAAEFRTLMKTETTREKARRCSREIIRDRNDTSGGGKVILVLLNYFNLDSKC